MKIAVLASDANQLKQATKAFAEGKPLVLESEGLHDEKAVSHLASLPDFQKDIVVGAALGTTLGVAAGIVLKSITQAHPTAGTLCEILAGVMGGAAGVGAAAKTAGTRTVSHQLRAVDINYDPKTRSLVAQLNPQTTKS